MSRAPAIEPDALPCPFCGGPAEIEFWHGGRPTKRMISCIGENCGTSPSVVGETREQALFHWNSRAAQPISPCQLAGNGPGADKDGIVSATVGGETSQSRPV